MALINVILQGLLFVYFTEITVSSSECIESASNVKQVDRCPRTEEEWDKAAAVKKCEKDSHSCSDLIYHCVMNAWRNETVEVCAPSRNIVGRVCPEYNTGGHRLQRSEKHCSDCPTTYDSSQSYKYQECYHHSQPQNQSTELQHSTSHIISHSQDTHLNISSLTLTKEFHAITSNYSVDASANGKSENVSSSTFHEKQRKGYLGYISVVLTCSMLVILLFAVLLYNRSKISSCITNYGSSVNENSTEHLLTIEGSQTESERSIEAKIQV